MYNLGMEALKFNSELVPMILSGKKTCTWRLWDDKDIQVGDIVTFINKPELKSFAEAEITYVKEKSMGEITKEDEAIIGHERYPDNYKAYSEYYGREMKHGTPVKVIRFKILKLL